MEDVLEEETGKISSLQEQVVKSWREHEFLSKNINLQFDAGADLLGAPVRPGGGLRAAVGSSFSASPASSPLWITINTVALLTQPFDPYPYIFLNLVLSGLAGFQAPIILMSQSRQDAKDRLRSEHDYQLNLKAELEIRHVNEKLDLLLTSQWRRLLEIQRIQMEVMEECVQRQSRRR